MSAGGLASTGASLDTPRVAVAAEGGGGGGGGGASASALSVRNRRESIPVPNSEPCPRFEPDDPV